MKNYSIRWAQLQILKPAPANWYDYDWKFVTVEALKLAMIWSMAWYTIVLVFPQS